MFDKINSLKNKEKEKVKFVEEEKLEKEKEIEMTGTVDRIKLISRLEQVQPGIALREIVAQSSCYIFQNGRVKTFNEEVFCSCKVRGFPEDFQGAIQAKPMLEILRKLSEDSLTLSVHTGEIQFEGVRKTVGIRMEQEITLPVNEVEDPGNWRDLPDDFSEGVALVQECAGKDTSTIYVNVRLTPD